MAAIELADGLLRRRPTRALFVFFTLYWPNELATVITSAQLSMLIEGLN